MSIHNE